MERILHGLATLLLAVIVAIPQVMASEPETEDAVDSCHLEVRECGVACIGGEGEKVVWRTHHPSLWEEPEEYIDGTDCPVDLELISVGDRNFYAVQADLLEIEGGLDGGIVRRVRFPAPISGVSPADGAAVDVTVREIGLNH